jgi:hypothetical protein
MHLPHFSGLVCATGYDAQFIMENFRRKGIVFKVTRQGNKLMELSIPALKIRIIDSLSFIPASLSSYPKMFQLEDSIRKGTYPYSFNTVVNWDYVGSMPPLNLFLESLGGPYVDGEELEARRTSEETGSDASSAGVCQHQRKAGVVSDSSMDLGDELSASQPVQEDDDEAVQFKKRCEMIRWWKSLAADLYVWNNAGEMEAYCKMDVKILALGCLAFRQNFITITTTDRWAVPDIPQTQSLGVDPFAYMTIASSSMATFKHMNLEPNQIGYFERYVDNHSLASIQWLEFLRSTQHLSIQHGRNGGEQVCIPLSLSLCAWL